MLGGLIVFGVTVVLLCAGVYMAVLRTPRCQECRVPFQPVEEIVRDLGLHGVETVTHYECSHCYGAMRRRLFSPIPPEQLQALARHADEGAPRWEEVSPDGTPHVPHQ